MKGNGKAGIVFFFCIIIANTDAVVPSAFPKYVE